MIRDIVIDHDGTRLTGEYHVPKQADPRAAILIFHSGVGLAAHERDVAARLVESGYAVLCADMYGAFPAGDRMAAGNIMMALRERPDMMRERTRLWHRALLSLDGVDPARIAVMGYCFGGMCVFELARSGAAACAHVAFHGLLATHAPATAIDGEVVAWCAGRDPYVSRADIEAFRAEMDAVGAAHQITTFAKAPHGFTDPASTAMQRDGIGYDPTADAVSWAGTMALFDRLFAD